MCLNYCEFFSQELLALRSQDKKSVQRVQSMLKRTKSANKSVLEDAVNYENTAVAIAGWSDFYTFQTETSSTYWSSQISFLGSLQPDEDDYGYVSKDAEELYNRLIDKYKCGPCENSSKTKTSIKTVKDISTTKVEWQKLFKNLFIRVIFIFVLCWITLFQDRVKAALQREEDEKLLPRKRKRKAKDGDVNQISDVEDSVDSSSEKVEEKPKSEKFKIPLKNVQTPPPMDFQSLLKLAEKKQHEPIIIQKPIQENPGRPMTQKEKVEYMRERERKIRREMQVTSSNDKLSKPITKESKAAKKPHTISLKSEVQTSRKEHIGLSSCSNQKSSRTVSKISQNEKLTHNLREAPNCKVVRSERPLLQTDKSKPFREFASSGKSETNVENSKICNETIESRLLLNNADLNKKKVLLTKSGKQYYAEQQSKSIMKKFVVNDEDRNSIKAVENPLEKESNRNAKLTMNKSTISRAHSSNVKRIPPPGVIGKNKFSSKLMKRSKEEMTLLY